MRMRKAALAGVLVTLLTSGTRSAGPQSIVFTRVFPNEGQIGLYVAAADGSGERLLLGTRGMDYDPVWSPDGRSIVFTSDREGSADLFRVTPDGSGLERLTDTPAYDDQATFSPDGRQLAFVSTRDGATSNIFILDIATRRARPLTFDRDGRYRPSWSPDGQWIAFSSSQGKPLTFAHGRWERLQFADIYVVHPDGTGLKPVGERGSFCGSPKWTADSRQIVAFCMEVEKTLETRRPAPQPGNDTRIVYIDPATGSSADVPAGPGVKFNPTALSANEIGYIRKDSDEPGIYYTSGARGPRGQVRAASWSPDGSRVVFHRRETAPTTWWKSTWSRQPDFRLALTSIMPAFGRDGDRFVVTARPPAGAILGSGIGIATPGSNTVKIVYQDPTRNVLGPAWAPNGEHIVFAVGAFNAFYNGFNSLFLKPGDRSERGAQIAIIKPDGTGFRELTKGPNNNAFPSMSPNGKQFVYRSFGLEGDGLRIMNIETNEVSVLSRGYDNFPLWSPRGDLIMFSRLAAGDYDVYTIKPDGTALKRITNSHGNDAHQAWSPDGEQIVLASSRLGFKDESVYTDAPQPYGELFVMKFDGTGARQLTDNQWEDGTPAWQPLTYQSDQDRLHESPSTRAPTQETR
jgi:Tol biopolymer transport system component